MAKGNHLSVLLSGLAILICSLLSSTTVGTRYQLPVSPQLRSIKPPTAKAGITDQQLRVKAVYDSQLGVKEEGSNAGAQVETYLRYVNLGKGNAWCAAFVCWVLGKANIPNPRTGWSPHLFPKTKTVWLNGSKQPQFNTGDVFGLYYPEKGRIAHAGFIDKREGSWLVTVEGNTVAVAGGQEGVYRKRRHVRSVDRVGRWIGW